MPLHSSTIQPPINIKQTSTEKPTAPPETHPAQLPPESRPPKRGPPPTHLLLLLCCLGLLLGLLRRGDRLLLALALRLGGSRSGLGSGLQQAGRRRAAQRLRHSMLHSLACAQPQQAGLQPPGQDFWPGPRRRGGARGGARAGPAVVRPLGAAAQCSTARTLRAASAASAALRLASSSACRRGGRAPTGVRQHIIPACVSSTYLILNSTRLALPEGPASTTGCPAPAPAAAAAPAASAAPPRPRAADAPPPRAAPPPPRPAGRAGAVRRR